MDRVVQTDLFELLEEREAAMLESIALLGKKDIEEIARYILPNTPDPRAHDQFGEEAIEGKEATIE